MGNELIAHIFDCDDIARKTGHILYSGFLSPAEMQSLTPIAHKLNGTLTFSAGYEGAERMLAVVTPQKCKEEIRLPIAYLEIHIHGEEELSHRDIMGAVLGLGLKRDALGDILVSVTPPVIAVAEKMVPYLKQELTKIGKATVDLKESLLPPAPPPPQVEEIVATVMSLRLDSVVSEGFGISRPDAVSAIKKGLVSLNWVECDSPAKEVKEKDKISLRGMGKIQLYEVGGQSRKGRTFLTIHRYL